MALMCGDGERLRQILPVDPGYWEELERKEQRQVVATAVEQVRYDRRLQQGRLRLREAVGSDTEVVFGASKERLVQQMPPSPTKRALGAESGKERVPRIAKLLALAVRFEELLGSGTVKDYADLARLGGVSPSRITQVMNLRSLAPALQERILFLRGEGHQRDCLNERALRRICGLVNWADQIQRFERLLPSQAECATR
jgi:hypothetical protein